ncbi:MAG: zf-HC2 domain-containing protein, partial [Gemmatimonadales bacterium]
MSHIDEGQLHAYLDGESGALTDREAVERHLETCAGCRERLDTERKLRERATAILSGSGPGAVSAPPFDDIVARSRAARVRSRYLRLNRMAALGWAAVIFLAVGVGWIARSTIGVDSPTQEVAAASGDSAPPAGFRILARGDMPEERAAPATGEAEPAASGRGAARRERSQ